MGATQDMEKTKRPPLETEARTKDKAIITQGRDYRNEQVSKDDGSSVYSFEH